MENKAMENNQVTIIGEIVSDLVYDHENHKEKFYSTFVSIKRLSETYDTLPVIVSERLIDVHKDYVGELIEVIGQFRSYNKHEGDKSRLILNVFAMNFNIYEQELNDKKCNTVVLDGYVCKNPIYRKTPMGREVTDLLLAVNRPFNNRSDYLPCIAWGRDARYASSFDLGTRVIAIGRIQSRKYSKRIGEDQYETRVAYEVSIQQIHKCEE